VTGRSTQAILDELSAILREFNGREYSGRITPRTRFFAELGLTSIDAVVLGEALERLYGRKLPFGQLLADLRQRQAEDVEVHDLVDFLHRHLNSPEGPSCPT
jgi:acyl carrier protein